MWKIVLQFVFIYLWILSAAIVYWPRFRLGLLIKATLYATVFYACFIGFLWARGDLQGESLLVNCLIATFMIPIGFVGYIIGSKTVDIFRNKYTDKLKNVK